MATSTSDGLLRIVLVVLAVLVLLPLLTVGMAMPMMGMMGWWGGGVVGGGLSPIWGVGMMLHPVALPSEATRPTTATLAASRRGDSTLGCLTYCGYGHAYMDLDGALVVR